MVKDKEIRQMGGKEGGRERQPLREGTGRRRGGFGLEPSCPGVVASNFWFVFTREREGSFPLHSFASEGAVL